MPTTTGSGPSVYGRNIRSSNVPTSGSVTRNSSSSYSSVRRRSRRVSSSGRSSMPSIHSRMASSSINRDASDSLEG